MFHQREGKQDPVDGNRTKWRLLDLACGMFPFNENEDEIERSTGSLKYYTVIPHWLLTISAFPGTEENRADMPCDQRRGRCILASTKMQMSCCFLL